ncbi:hypothetical protein C8R44DRAFT_864618 [Mycena epipterygia]|nr:hypothetical protein C8R44DRAFT_864618 [Mycena epipterygia]
MDRPPSSTTPLSASLKNHTIFPMPGLQLLSSFIHFIGVTILTHFLSRRLGTEDLPSRPGWERITAPYLLVLFVLLDSYLFILSTEKVDIVLGNGVRRLRSPLYLLYMVTVSLCPGVVAAMIYGGTHTLPPSPPGILTPKNPGKMHEFRSGDGAYARDWAQVPSNPPAPLVRPRARFIKILLTVLFVWPLLRIKCISADLKQVSTHTLLASTASLTTSTVNIAILTLLGGRELGWLCLGSCGTDVHTQSPCVIFNATAIFWVTRGRLTASNGHAAESLTDLDSGILFSTGLPRSSTQRSGLKAAAAAFPLGQPKASARQFEVHMTTTSFDVEISPQSQMVRMPQSLKTMMHLDNSIWAICRGQGMRQAV